MTQAVAWGHSPSEEIVFLVVHGLLHLLGWRDDTDEQRQSMLDRQHDLFERWRQQASRGGRLDPGERPPQHVGSVQRRSPLNLLIRRPNGERFLTLT